MPAIPPLYLVAEAPSAAFWLEDGYLIGCPLDRYGRPDFEAAAQEACLEPGHVARMKEALANLAALANAI